MHDLNRLFSLSGRHVLVTGTSSGIGRHFAEFFAGCGAKVSAVARRRDRLQELEAAVMRTNGSLRVGVCDVTKAEAVAQAFAEAEAAYGPVDVVVNNAGISIVKAALQMDLASWKEVVDTNLNGAWIVAQHAAKAMVAARRPGSIINIASVIGLRTFAGVAPYAASKLGLVALTRNLAIELADQGIRVNAVVPGMFDTELGGAYKSTNPERRNAMIQRAVPMKRVGRHDELDGIMALLASDAGSYMTGSVIGVDGGLTVSSIG